VRVNPGATPAHPTAGLSEIVHQRHRLGILTITSRSRQADFGYLREALSLTSGNLSTHLTVVTALGYYWQLVIPAAVVLRHTALLPG